MPSFYTHRDPQHAKKAVKAAPIARPSKRQLVGHSNQVKKALIAIEKELKAQALLQSLSLPDRLAEAMKRVTLRFPTVNMKAMWSSISKASDGLRVEKLNKGHGGAQPTMREGFIYSKGLPDNAVSAKLSNP